MRRWFVFAWAAILLSLGAPASAETVFVRAGRVLDVRTGAMARDQLIRIEDGRIAAIARFPSHAPPRVTADWSAFTVLPGLIDCHTHLVGDIQSADPLAPVKSGAANDVLHGVANARATLHAGFTSVRDVGSYRAFADVALKRAIDDGRVEGPRMHVAGAYLTIPGGGGEVVGMPQARRLPADLRFGVVRTPQEAAARATTLIDSGATFLKLIATGAVLTIGTEPGKIELSQTMMRAAVQEAALRNVYVTAHAHGAEGVKAAVRAGVRSIEHGSLIDDEGIALMAARGTFLVADIYNGDYIDMIGARDNWPEETLRKNRETSDAQRDGFRKAVLAGVKIAYGTDAGVFPHGLNARQFAYHVRFGQSPLQAIQSATLNAADMLGWSADVGVLEVGQFADMIAVSGDPLQDVRILENVRGVIKGGVLIKEP
jgi:imidazolonepropionase-like amidohydrolase